jgi:hypothetical protein
MHNIKPGRPPPAQRSAPRRTSHSTRHEPANTPHRRPHRRRNTHTRTRARSHTHHRRQQQRSHPQSVFAHSYLHLASRCGPARSSSNQANGKRRGRDQKRSRRTLSQIGGAETRIARGPTTGASPQTAADPPTDTATVAPPGTAALTNAGGARIRAEGRAPTGMPRLTQAARHPQAKPASRSGPTGPRVATARGQNAPVRTKARSRPNQADTAACRSQRPPRGQESQLPRRQQGSPHLILYPHKRPRPPPTPS